MQHTSEGQEKVKREIEKQLPTENIVNVEDELRTFAGSIIHDQTHAVTISDGAQTLAIALEITDQLKAK